MSAQPSTSVLPTPLASVHAQAGAALRAWFGCALPDHFGDWLAEHRCSRETAVLLDKSYRAYLSFTGPDRVRYLNAILTNNIRDLAAGEANISLLLNPQGHILAEIEVQALPERLFGVSYAMVRPLLLETLDKFIIMDDVTLADDSEHYATLGIEGPRAAEIVHEAASVDLRSLAELAHLETTVCEIPCRLSRRSPGGVAGAEFLVEREHLADLWRKLCDLVTQAGGRPGGYQALNALRLEQRLPWFGYDFGPQYIPHEAGLENSHISYTKGCYTGQEIVERVRSRGQVNRIRALLKFAAKEPPAAGAKLFADGKEAGHVTRSAFSPTLGTAIGMGYVRREHSATGTQLQCGAVKAEVF